MELNKSLILTIFISSFLFASIDATLLPHLFDRKLKHDFSKTVSYAPAASPSPSETITTKYPTIEFPKLPPNKKIDHKLRYVCGATENTQKCISLLAPYVKGSVNVASTLRVIIKTLRVHIKEASKIAVKLRDDESTSHEMMAALDTSVELYDLALGSITKASAAYKNLDVHRFKVLLGAAISNLGYCNEAFEKKGLTSWPLKQTNEILIELAGYGVDISSKFSKYVTVEVKRTPLPLN